MSQAKGGGGELRRRLTVENIKADLCLFSLLSDGDAQAEVGCAGVSVDMCRCVCVCVWVVAQANTQGHQLVSVLWGSVNECFAADKQNNCNKKFFFICLTHTHTHSLKCFLCHTSPLMLCVCVCACCVFYSLALYSK